MANQKKSLYNLKAIEEYTGIPYMKLYNCRNGVYSSLTEDEKEKIKEFEQSERTLFFDSLSISV